VSARPAAAVRTMLLGLALSGCPTSRVPSHLAPPDASGEQASQERIQDLDDLVRAMISKDPLGRTAGNISVQTASSVPGGEPYAELLRIATVLEPGKDDALRRIRDLEAAHRGTPLVALSRGARVREIEAVVGAQTRLDDAAEARVLALLTPLSSTENASNQPARPLRWLSETTEVRDPVLTAADRWALLGWLDGPEMDLQPVADALSTPPYDTLRRTPAARLVLARATGGTGDPEPGMADLERATRLLLTEAVADRKREREAVAAAWLEVGEDLDSDAPRDALLSRAERTLSSASSSKLGTGGALLALQARRLWGDCPNAPCIGLDRVEGLSAAARWDPRLARLSRLLQIAALHDAIDGIEVARGTVRYPQAAVHLADALIGTGAVPPDALLVRQRSPDASTWLTLGRSVGTEHATTWEEARAALRAWAATQARKALEGEQDPQVRAALEAVIRAGS